MPPIEWIDSPDIGPGEILWRMISPHYLKLTPTGSLDVSEGAFRTDQMSVFRATLIGLGEAMSRFPGFRVAAFTAEHLRSIGCILVQDPDDPAHVLVCRADNPHGRLRGSQANNLRNNVKWLTTEDAE